MNYPLNYPVTYDCVPHTGGFAVSDHSVTWTFEDGGSASTKSANHVWTTLGAKNATVNVLCIPTGGTATTSKSITIDYYLLDVSGPADFTFTNAMPDTQTATFTVDASFLTGTKTYEWHKIENGVDTIVGTNSPSYTTDTLIFLGLRYYFNTKFYCIVNGTYISRRATLLVDSPTGHVTETLGGVPVGTVYVDATLSANQTGAAALYVRWYGVVETYDQSTRGAINATDTVSFNNYRVPIGPPYNGNPLKQGYMAYVYNPRGSYFAGLWFATISRDNGAGGLIIEPGYYGSEETYGPTLELVSVTKTDINSPVVITYKGRLARTIFDPFKVDISVDYGRPLIVRTNIPYSYGSYNEYKEFDFVVTYPSLGGNVTISANLVVQTNNVPSNSPMLSTSIVF